MREGRIRGTLFIPPGDGPFPGKWHLTVHTDLFILFLYFFQRTESQAATMPRNKLSRHQKFIIPNKCSEIKQCAMG